MSPLPTESTDDARADAALHADAAEAALEEGADHVAVLEAMARSHLALASRLGQLSASLNDATKALRDILSRLPEPPG